jgi:protein TonB
MESLPDLPAPDAAARSVARSSRQFVVAVTVSAVAHGGTIGLILAGHALWFGPRLEPPERGVSSVALVAAVAAETEPTEAVEFVATTDVAAESVEAPSTRLASRRTRNEPVYPMLPQAEIPPAGFVQEVIDEASADFPSARSARPAERRADHAAVSKSSPSFEPRRTQSMPAARVATSHAIVETGSTASRRQTGAKVDVLPSKRYSPDPTYPPAALARRLTGVVKVRAKVGADGRVASVALYRSSGVRSLDEAALEAVRRWRFDPAKRDGRAVAYEVVVPLRFTLVE